jgi:hypothetical protein
MSNYLRPNLYAKASILFQKVLKSENTFHILINNSHLIYIDFYKLG